MTFAKGKQILDDLTIANKVVDDAKKKKEKKKKEMFMFKVNFEKAYDSIDCGYLRLVMSKMGFPWKWRK